VVHRLAAVAGRLDEHLKIGPRGSLAYELGKPGRAQGNIQRIIATACGGGQTAQLLNSRNPNRISFSVGVSSPSRATIRAKAAEAWALE
jgi:hypothetical protein